MSGKEKSEKSSDEVDGTETRDSSRAESKQLCRRLFPSLQFDVPCNCIGRFAIDKLASFFLFVPPNCELPRR